MRGNPGAVISPFWFLVAAFIGTNLDAIVVLGLLFAIDQPAYRRHAIAAASAGFIVVLIAAIAVALVAHGLPASGSAG